MNEKFQEVFDKQIVNALIQKTDPELESFAKNIDGFAKIQIDADIFPGRRGIIQALSTNDNPEGELLSIQKKLGVHGKLFTESYSETDICNLLSE